MTKELIDFLIGGIENCRICPLKTYCDLPSNEEIDNCKAIKKKWLTENYLEPDPVQEKSTVSNLIDFLAQKTADKDTIHLLCYVADILDEAQKIWTELTPLEISKILIELNNIDANIGIYRKSVRDVIIDVVHTSKQPPGLVDMMKEKKDV